MQVFQYILQQIKSRGFPLRSIVDVGANKGEASCSFFKIFPKAGWGVLIEPHPDLVPPLVALVQNRGWKDTSVLHGGAGRVSGEFPFYYGSEDSEYRGSTFARRHDDKVATDWFNKEVMVPVYSLDDLLAQHRIAIPDFLKLDAEGLELEILKGAETLLGPDKVQLIHLETTLFPSLMEHPSVGEIISWLEARDYVLYDIGDLGRRPSDKSLVVLDLYFVRKDSVLRSNPYWS